MTRNIVVTGAGYGNGAMCAQLVEDRGDHAIGVDLRSPEFEVDLSGADALATVVEESEEQYGHVHGVIANAGTQSSSPLDLKVNYFGARNSVTAFLPLLQKSNNARVAITASAASL